MDFSRLDAFLDRLTSWRVPGNDCIVVKDGEIVYRGPSVMEGYWNNPEANADAFAGGQGGIFFTVPRDSYAAQWCRDNNVRYTYPDANNWLLN